MTLSEQALEVLALLKQLDGNSELVFPGERDSEKPMSNMTILEALKRIGYRGEITGHGFRGIASTILHELAVEQLSHFLRNKKAFQKRRASFPAKHPGRVAAISELPKCGLVPST